MGWNAVDGREPHPYIDGSPTARRFYFVHSFAPDVHEDRSGSPSTAAFCSVATRTTSSRPSSTRRSPARRDWRSARTSQGGDDGDRHPGDRPPRRAGGPAAAGRPGRGDSTATTPSRWRSGSRSRGRAGSTWSTSTRRSARATTGSDPGHLRRGRRARPGRRRDPHARGRGRGARHRRRAGGLGDGGRRRHLVRRSGGRGFAERVVVALDVRDGRLMIDGWREGVRSSTPRSPG